MLHLYLIRHAEAVPTNDPNFRDADRPLTEKGRADARRLGEVLAEHGIRFQAILTSPLVRAKETAELLAAGLGSLAPTVEEIEELAPGEKFRRLDRELIKREGDAIALVGHQPDLGDYAARLIGSKKASIKLDKPGIACVACDDPPGKDCGELIWLLSPEWIGIALPKPVEEKPILIARKRG